MIVTLIGFSGSGKSYWSSRFEKEKGFFRIDCDKRIEEKLHSDMAKIDGEGINAVADWMGQPYEEGFKDRQDRYLSFEIDTMQEIIDSSTALQSEHENVVIDTSGSVIYTGEETLRKIKEFSTMVYLEITRQEYDLMLARYINDPKPVVWGDIYKKQSNEREDEALVRCFRELIKQRRKLYEEQADVTLSFDQHAERMLSSDDFLSLIGQH